MAHEEHGQRCSNSSSDDRGLECGGFGRSSKRLKQKRVPQRGLGVAQLERIRLEEQHKKDATLLSATVLSSFPAVSHTNSSTCLQIQQQLPSIVSPAFRPHLSSPSIPLPPPIDLTSPRPAFRSIPPPHIPKINGMHPSPVVPLSLSKSLSVGVVERSWSGIMVPGHGHWPKLWNGDDNLEGENHRMDHQGVEFRPSMKFPIEPHSPILPLPSMLQRSERHEQPVSSSMNLEIYLQGAILNPEFHRDIVECMVGRADELIQPSRVSAGSDQPHIFSFFPSTGQEDSPKSSGHEGESSEGVDLNLKL
nr:uncharacterized protein LOC109187311 [Ipomoea trifida]